jgi:hypothetical protein
MNILETVEINGHWFVAYKSKYDADCERTVISGGITKDIALEQAILRCVTVFEKCATIVDKIADLTGGYADIEGIGEYVEVPGIKEDINGEIVTTIGAIYKHDDEEMWSIYFR